MPRVTHQRRSRLLWRMSFGLCAAAMFVGVASVIKPPPRSATASPDELRRSAQQSPTIPLDASNSGTPDATLIARVRDRMSNVVQPTWKLLGMLESRQHIVLCYGTPDGPRYSVYTIQGDLLRPGMHADDVYRSFPDVDIENMHLEPGPSGPVMLMDKE